MARDPGKRDKLITFERLTSAEDDHGEEIGTWAALPGGTRWAAVFYGAGNERREAARSGGSQAASFVVLDDELTRTITIRDRLQFGGAWDIKAAGLPVSGEIEFQAVRAS